MRVPSRHSAAAVGRHAPQPISQKRASNTTSSPGQRRGTHSNRAAGRRGSFMVLALVCLLLTTLIAGSLLRIAVIDRRQCRIEQFRLQADWLAESAVARAAYRLTTDSAYSGETWDIPPAELNSRHAGRIRISVAFEGDGSNRRRVTAVARFPAEGDRFATRTKTITVHIDSNP